ncbi:hypothetical protein GCM10010912_22160 [Paenibacillus albidus]|uniref:DUF4062 domain-containing protein n=1 Tax=Paenibacillus albidus TaxID=2041023 RepID=A0A917FFK9_9BACL|nr:DUF4062 domain-containing protein [Paenibacillus albidus]GGF76615.1 hypothetical protein GCM10010912_22160 [Paenibacillus albidus]
MKKKLQVFISSTYTDMIEERQAAVSAVLNSGHIPAGMELFKSGDQSQKTTIMRWIQESDVYMLILGGRYGSIDAESGKSYTHWEYDYAGELGKRRFAIVIDDKKLDEKARENKDYLEREHYKEYQAFKTEVLGNISKFYEDLKDIRLATMESLKEFESDDSLIGWVKADQAGGAVETLKENVALLKEIAKLKAELEKAKEKEQQKEKVMINGWDYEELKDTLAKIIIETPNGFKREDKEKNSSLLVWFVTFEDIFNIGITNSNVALNEESDLFHTIAPKLISYGLLEKIKVTGVKYEKIQTSKEGLKFLAKYQMEKVKSLPPIQYEKIEVKQEDQE